MNVAARSFAPDYIILSLLRREQKRAEFRPHDALESHTPNLSGAVCIHHPRCNSQLLFNGWRAKSNLVIPQCLPYHTQTHLGRPLEKGRVMSIIATWPKFLQTVRPFLTSVRPIEALKQAGMTLGGDVAEAFQRTTVHAVDPAAFQRLITAYGPPPRIALHIGRPRRAVARILGGYRSVTSANLSMLNDVLAELWRVRTIPNEFSESQTGQVITLDELKDACTGVPDDARLGRLALTGPPVASASTILPKLHLHFAIPFNLPVETSGPASLRGVVQAELPLEFESRADLNETELRIRPTHAAIERLEARLEVSPVSFLQPRSVEKRQVLERALAAALRTVVLVLFYGSDKKPVLSIPGDVSISSTFPNSIVKVSQIGVVSVRSGSRDFLVAGVNVESPQNPDPSELDTFALASAELPAGSNNLHAVIDQTFASDALSAIITSGDLAVFFNRMIERHEGPFEAAGIHVKGGSVAFDGGLLFVSIDCVLPGLCTFGVEPFEITKDLNFTATAFGTPRIENGTLTIEGSEVDFDLDDTDAVVCLLMGSLHGPLSLLINEGVLAFIAAYNPTGRNFEYPTMDTSRPLPGTDKDFKIELTQAAVRQGAIVADGQGALIPDTLRAFVYLRLVTAPASMVTVPLVGAAVELIELHSPAPPGDDVVIPETGETERPSGRYVINDVRTYTPLPDQSLATQVTDQTGFVRFAAVCRSVAGIFTEIVTREEPATGKVISSTKHTRQVLDPTPDFAITVTDAGGRVWAKRSLIALNPMGKRVGTPDQPLVVQLQPPDAIQSGGDRL
jgi:hypothetical protein